MEPTKNIISPERIAIHQPNYLPWLGYFHKMASADVFVFLDDVQFSKGSYTNRVRILSPKGPKWLTVPVSVHLGDPINLVRPSNGEWVNSHLDTLRGIYRDAPAFQEAWPFVEALFRSVPAADLAAVNEHLVRGLANQMGFSCVFRRSSEFKLSSSSDERLVELVSQAAPHGIYLSGRGAARYQNPDKFTAAGLGFAYVAYQHPRYPQGGHLGVSRFEEGLSVLDAAFHLGWEETADMIRGKRPK